MSMRSRTLAVLALAAVPLALGAAPFPAAVAEGRRAEAADPVRWEIDTAHSELTFRIRHLVSRVSGSFNQWSGTVVADPADLSGGSVEVTIQTASIFTNHERRDAHLRSDDFFDAPNHPTITFRSTRVEPRGRDLRVHGNLTIRGVTRPVVLEGRMLEVAGPPGRRRMALEATTTIDRMDYGVSWNRAAEIGGVVLGDEVQISLLVAAVEGSG
jgi:polyisoprenoid-binding protein YceI